MIIDFCKRLEKDLERCGQTLRHTPFDKIYPVDDNRDSVDQDDQRHKE